MTSDIPHCICLSARIYVLGAGMFGKITRITQDGTVWVKVKPMGNHHHAATQNLPLSQGPYC